MEGLDYLGASMPDAKVRAAQEALSAAGFDTKGVDGLIGPNTEAAITAFWASKGLSHAAVVDDDLMKALATTAPVSKPAPKTTALVPAEQSPVTTSTTSQNTTITTGKKLAVIAVGVATAIAGVIVLYSAGRS